jgi:hypothetical protein
MTMAGEAGACAMREATNARRRASTLAPNVSTRIISTRAPASYDRAFGARHATCGRCVRVAGHRHCIAFPFCASHTREKRVIDVDEHARHARTERIDCARTREKFTRDVASAHRFLQHASHCARIDTHQDAERARPACARSHPTRVQYHALM